MSFWRHSPSRARSRTAWSAIRVFVVSAALSYGLVGHGDPLTLLGWPAGDQPVIAATSAPAGPAAQSGLLPVVTGPPAAGSPGLLPAAELATVSLTPALAGPAAEAGHLRVVTGHIAVGSTIVASLHGQGVSDAVIYEIANALEHSFDFRQARAGDFYAVITDENGDLLSFEFRRGRGDIYRLDRKPGGALQPRAEEKPLERRVVQLGGVVHTTLFDSLTELGEKAEIAQRLADVFAWDFDFARQTRPGDEFRMVFEKFYDRDGFVRYGKLLAARYASSSRELTAFYFEDEEGRGDYYTPDGNSVRRSFLRAPLTYTRVSSGYTKSRLHPIFKVRRPHEGIDYAAPTGTPVWAVANGSVSFIGWKGGFGKLVQVKHENGYVSYYGHLSRFSKRLRVGSRVHQQDVIGYVGSTGYATGPHLDYRLQYKGRFVNPLGVKFAQGRPIPRGDRQRFDRLVESRSAELNEAAPALVLEAGM